MRAARKLWYSGLVASYGRRRPVCQTRNDLLCRVICLAIVGNSAKLWILVFRRVVNGRRTQMSSPGAPHFTGTAARSLIPRAEPSDKSYDSCKLRAFLRLEISFIPRTSFCYASVYSSGHRAGLTGETYHANMFKHELLYYFTSIVDVYPELSPRLLNFK